MICNIVPIYFVRINDPLMFFKLFYQSKEKFFDEYFFWEINYVICQYYIIFLDIIWKVKHLKVFK